MKKNLSYFLFFISTLTTTTIACPEMHGSFEISNQSAVFLKGSEAGAAYLTISQTAETDDKLIAVKVRIDEEQSKGFLSRFFNLFSGTDHKKPRVELHDHVPTTENPNILTMKRIKDGVIVSGATKDIKGKLIQAQPVKFEKNGKHLMLYNFPASVRNGDKIELVLVFEKTGDIPVTFPINHTLIDQKPCPHHH